MTGTETLPRPPAGFIRGERCESCKFSSPMPREDPECRLSPPNSTAMVVGVAKRGDQNFPQIQTISAFPRVKPTDWCGQWRAKIAAA